MYSQSAVGLPTNQLGHKVDKEQLYDIESKCCPLKSIKDIMKTEKASKTKSRWIGIRYLIQAAAMTTWVYLLVHAPTIESQVEPSGQKTSMNQLQKVGLAPNERPSCQLQTVYNRRQVLASSADKQLNQPVSPILNQDGQFDGISQTNNGTTSNKHPVISSPTVLSLQAPGASFANNLASGLSGRRFDSSERLRQLRQLLISNNYDAYLVTPNDEHGSDYVTEYDRRLRFISGFTGSNGYALILLDRAVLFTDGRYQLQADEDLDCNWWLVVGDDPLTDIAPWLKAQAAKGIKVATDARLMSLQSFDYLDDQLRRQESEFVLISQDLVDVVWDTNVASGDSPARFAATSDPIFVHPLQFTGNTTWQEKLVKLAGEMSKLKARHYVVSQLDDIAWLLNLRGNDIPMAPLFKAYVFLSRSSEPAQSVNSVKPITNSMNVDQASQGLQAPQVLQVPAGQTIRLTLYVDLNKVNQQVRDHLHVENGTILVTSLSPDQQPITTRIQIELKDYQVFVMDLRDRLSPAAGARQLQGRLLLNAGANVAIHVLAKSYEDRLVLVESLINKMKSVKSDAEVQGMRLAHWRDSLAISMLLSQLDRDIGQMGQVERWTEISAAKELEFYRSLMDYNKGQSFDTISAYGSNAAVVHYRPDENLPHKLIGNQSTYLLDSGGQYLDGTTDITRTVHYGKPSELQRETYTRVLMGSIDTMSLIFDQSSRTPYRIADLLARRHLFELGLDYQHGTGHGIGLFSLVHEAPWLIENYATTTNAKPAGPTTAKQGAQVSSDPVIIQANMFTSVEPGYYKANDFGIRLENIVVSQRVNLPTSLSRPNDRQQEVANKRQFLRWEPISLVPFEPKLIKLELLSNKQKAWLNSYNLMVRFRMTQQINYYLNKIRNQQQERKPIQVQGSASSSRLYQQLLKSINNDTSASKQERYVDMVSQGQNNYLRLDAAKLQDKLELTHRWIMSKTELIPLDVPQTLVATKLTSDASSSNQLSKGKPAEVGSTRPESLQQDSHRLMLVYMSSFPFNDREAGEAVASATQLGARADEKGAQPAASGDATTAKQCTGFQCDLWLLNSLDNFSRQRRQPDSVGARGSAEGSLLPTWAEHDLELDESINLPHKNGSPLSSTSLLHDLFKLGTASQTGATINMWSLLVLGILVSVQVAVAVYLCRGGNKSSRVQIAQNQPESVQLSSSS